MTSVRTELHGTESRIRCRLVAMCRMVQYKTSLKRAPCRIGNFFDKQTQRVVDFVGALGMHEWEGTID
jgi:hypothetical protein